MALVTVSGLVANQDALPILESKIRTALVVRDPEAQAVIDDVIVEFPQDLLGARETVSIVVSHLTSNEAHLPERRKHIADAVAALLVEYLAAHPQRCKRVKAHVSLSSTVTTSTLYVS